MLILMKKVRIKQILKVCCLGFMFVSTSSLKDKILLLRLSNIIVCKRENYLHIKF